MMESHECVTPPSEGEDIVRHSGENRRGEDKEPRHNRCKRDVERAYVGVDNAAVTGSASVAREMASATQQIASGNAIDAGSNATDALTEAKLLDAHEACYNAGGDPSLLMIKPADSEIVAGFTGSSGRTRNFNDETKTLTNVVDVMVNPLIRRGLAA